MLAFTTYLEPRNLLIDLAFLGLSTITSAWLPRGASSAAADFRGAFFGAPLPRLTVDFADDRLGTAGFEVLPLPSVAAPEDFLATVSSYLSSSISVAWVDPFRPFTTWEGGLFEVALGENPDTIQLDP